MSRLLLSSVDTIFFFLLADRPDNNLKKSINAHHHRVSPDQRVNVTWALNIDAATDGWAHNFAILFLLVAPPVRAPSTPAAACLTLASA